MQMLTWEDVLQRQDLIDGEMEVQEGLPISCGPLSKIEKKGGHIIFYSPWSAQLNTEDLQQKWVKLDDAHNVPVSVTTGATPYEDKGEIIIKIPGMTIVLRPKGKNKVDPKLVVGLSTT